jgi:hypothetical protein
MLHVVLAPFDPYRITEFMRPIMVGFERGRHAGKRRAVCERA